MFKGIGFVLGGLICLLVGAVGIALLWPMPNPDTEPFMEILPPPDEASARPHTTFTGRDGTSLPLRTYEADDSDTALVLAHGAGLHGDFLHRVASHLAAQSIATVFVPDLRGHGDSSETHGDIDYVAQLVDDLADLIFHVRQQGSWKRVIVGGHSMGGGLSLRFAGTEYAENVEGYLLIAPLLSFDAPTITEEYGGYIFPNTPRIMALTILNSLGIHAFDGLKVLRMNPPDDVDHATTRYSWRLTRGMTTHDYTADLAAIDVPLLLLAGDEDEMFAAEHYSPIIEAFAPHGEVVIKPDLNHVTDVLNHPAVLDRYAAWIESL